MHFMNYEPLENIVCGEMSQETILTTVHSQIKFYGSLLMDVNDFAHNIQDKCRLKMLMLIVKIQLTYLKFIPSLFITIHGENSSIWY